MSATSTSWANRTVLGLPFASTRLRSRACRSATSRTSDDTPSLPNASRPDSWMVSIHRRAPLMPPATSVSMTTKGTRSRIAPEPGQELTVQLVVERWAAERQEEAALARSRRPLMAQRVVLAPEDTACSLGQPLQCAVVEQGPQRSQRVALEVVGVQGEGERFGHHPFGQRRLAEAHLAIVEGAQQSVRHRVH